MSYSEVVVPPVPAGLAVKKAGSDLPRTAMEAAEVSVREISEVEWLLMCLLKYECLPRDYRDEVAHARRKALSALGNAKDALGRLRGACDLLGGG